MSLFAKAAAFLGLRGFIALGLGLALVLAGFHIRTLNAKLEDARETIAALLDWQTGIVDAVRIASNNPDVDSTTAAAQVQELGIIRIELKNAVERQNEALDEMDRQSREAMRIAEQAERRRRQATAKADELRRKLEARAQIPAPAERMEQAVRDAQDAAFREGL